MTLAIAVDDLFINYICLFPLLSSLVVLFLNSSASRYSRLLDQRQKWATDTTANALDTDPFAANDYSVNNQTPILHPQQQHHLINHHHHHTHVHAGDPQPDNKYQQNHYSITHPRHNAPPTPTRLAPNTQSQSPLKRPKAEPTVSSAASNLWTATSRRSFASLC